MMSSSRERRSHSAETSRPSLLIYLTMKMAMKMTIKSTKTEFGSTGTRTGSLAATIAFFQSLPARLAAARNYWLAAGGLSILVLAIVVFWRIPDEPRSGVIELAAPLAEPSAAPVETTAENLAVPPSAGGQIRRPATPERVPSAPIMSHGCRGRHLRLL